MGVVESGGNLLSPQPPTSHSTASHSKVGKIAKIIKHVVYAKRNVPNVIDNDT